MPGGTVFTGRGLMHGGALNRKVGVGRIAGWAAVLAAVLPAAMAGSDPRLDDLAVQARGPGLRGAMHGATADGAFVFTWWDPKSFFSNLNFPLIPVDARVEAELAGLERHQQVTVRGELVRPAGSQPHLRVAAVTPGEKWSPGVTPTEVWRQPPPVERLLAGRERIAALVHATEEDGSVLVVEYRDAVLPAVVPDDIRVREQVRELFRGDRILLRFRLRRSERRPAHLLVETGSPDRPAIEVTDSLHAQHRRERALEGRLVLFPKSPALRREIWGVEERGPNGLHRYFTLANFETAGEMDRIGAKARAAWESRPGILDARNKYVHLEVRVRAAGTVSNPARNQANPTLITDAARIELR
jgi:hypothetical protein